MSNSSGIGIEDESKTGQPDNLSIFCREVRNLLRSKPNCIIPFSKFVPAYHNHYGRQCCVYQFGFTKLIELLESIPHVVQIIGDGTNRYITLTQREQVKRFASDLIKVVKSQPGKKLKLSQFAQAYEQVLGRTFRIEDYGTNNINILLAEIWEGTINIIPIRGAHSLEGPLFVKTELPENPVLRQLIASKKLVYKPYITAEHPDAWFEIPKRERTEREIRRTRYFARDVVELLSGIPDYSVPFSRFIPQYHYYYNRQCKVSIYGFSKLIDLFEAISPDVVEILDQGPGEEKLIRLAARHWPSNRMRSIQPARHHSHSHSNSHSHSHNQINGHGQHHRNQGHSHHHPLHNNHVQQHYHHHHQHQQQLQSGQTKSGLFVQQNRSPTKLSYNGEATDEFSSDEEDDELEDEMEVLEEVELDEEEEDDDDNENDELEDEEVIADDVILSSESSSSSSLGLSPSETQQQQPIDSGPTEEELMELEDEIEAYEELQAIQSKRSTRMAASLDIFKQSIYKR